MLTRVNYFDYDITMESRNVILIHPLQERIVFEFEDNGAKQNFQMHRTGHYDQCKNRSEFRLIIKLIRFRFSLIFKVFFEIPALHPPSKYLCYSNFIHGSHGQVVRSRP